MAPRVNAAYGDAQSELRSLSAFVPQRRDFGAAPRRSFRDAKA